MDYTTFEKEALQAIQEMEGYPPHAPSLRRDGIVVRWTVGGYSGGDCWGGTASDRVGSETEPEMAELDAILLGVTPELSFVHYKKILKDVIVDEGTTTENEYYDNSTTYQTKRLRLTDLHAYLDREKLLP